MNSLLAFVLVASINPHPTCAYKLEELGRGLEDWSRLYQKATPTHLESAFGHLNIYGNIRTLRLVAATGAEVGLLELAGFSAFDTCNLQGVDATLLFRQIIK